MLDFDRAVSKDVFICNSEAQEIYAVLGASHWMTPFAMQAFIIASTASEEEMLRW